MKKNTYRSERTLRQISIADDTLGSPRPKTPPTPRIPKTSRRPKIPERVPSRSSIADGKGGNSTAVIEPRQTSRLPVRTRTSIPRPSQEYKSDEIRKAGEHISNAQPERRGIPAGCTVSNTSLNQNQMGGRELTFDTKRSGSRTPSGDKSMLAPSKSNIPRLGRSTKTHDVKETVAGSNDLKSENDQNVETCNLDLCVDVPIVAKKSSGMGSVQQPSESEVQREISKQIMNGEVTPKPKISSCSMSHKSLGQTSVSGITVPAPDDDIVTESEARLTENPELSVEANESVTQSNEGVTLAARTISAQMNLSLHSIETGMNHNNADQEIPLELVDKLTKAALDDLEKNKIKVTASEHQEMRTLFHEILAKDIPEADSKENVMGATDGADTGLNDSATHPIVEIEQNPIIQNLKRSESELVAASNEDKCSDSANIAYVISDIQPGQGISPSIALATLGGSDLESESKPSDRIATGTHETTGVNVPSTVSSDPEIKAASSSDFADETGMKSGIISSALDVMNSPLDCSTSKSCVDATSPEIVKSVTKTAQGPEESGSEIKPDTLELPPRVSQVEIDRVMELVRQELENKPFRPGKYAPNTFEKYKKVVREVPENIQEMMENPRLVFSKFGGTQEPIVKFSEELYLQQMISTKEVLNVGKILKWGGIIIFGIGLIAIITIVCFMIYNTIFNSE